MMKRRFLLVAVGLLLVCAGCRKTCRCYRYDGNVDEFTKEDLEVYDRSCTGMENFDLGIRYSICEWVMF